MFPRTSGWESVSGIGEARHPIHSPHLRLGSVDASIVIGANHYTTFKNPSFQRFQPLRMKITKDHLRLTPFPWLSTMFIQKYQLDPVDLVSALLPVGTVSHSLYRSAPQNQSKKHTFQTKPKITQWSININQYHLIFHPFLGRVTLCYVKLANVANPIINPPINQRFGGHSGHHPMSFGVYPIS